MPKASSSRGARVCAGVVSESGWQLGGVSVRALVTGLLLTALVCLIVSYAELVIVSIQIGFLQMPPAVLGLFFFLVLVNRGMQRLGERLSLARHELLMIYCMMLVAAMISSRGVMEKLLGLLVAPDYYANPTNEWQKWFFPHLRKWLVPFDPSKDAGQPVSVQFFERLRSGDTIPWGAWAVPLAAWGSLILLVIFAFLCIATILRKQWVDNEKLPFPLVQLPLELSRSDEPPSLLHNRLLWGGMALPVFVFTVNGLHNAFPSVPNIMLSVFLNQYIVSAPWNQIYWFGIFCSFAAIGFFFLLPTELLFSLWFFALFARAQDVVAASYGMDMPRMPIYGTYLYVAYQTVGAYFVLAAYFVYVAMPHLKKVLRSALMRERQDDRDELMSYPVAFWGLIVCFILILMWCLAAGMSLLVATIQFGVFLFVIAIVMARSTAEAGMLMTETSFRPADVYRLFAPVHSVGPANLTMLALTDTLFLRDQRGLLLTGFLDSLKLSDGAGVRRRAFLPVLGLAVISALIIAGAIQLWLPYTHGGLNLYQYAYRGVNFYTWVEYQSHMAEAARLDWQAWTFTIVGAVFTVFLAYMRTAFFWWPFHPLGYALCISWTMTVFWFSCLIAWIVKVFLLRYGGMRLYIKARPFFLGMVLGEFGMAIIWTLISGLTGARAPEFPWP